MVLATVGRRCLRLCQLPRPFLTSTTTTTTTATATACFSTSVAASNKSSRAPVQGSRKPQASLQQRIGQKGGSPVVEVRKAAYKLGERKILRQAIILSNTNAPHVKLEELDIDISTHENAVGSVFALGGREVDRLRALDAFRRSQDWKFFYHPATVMRRESLVLGEMMAWIQHIDSEARTPEQKCERIIMSGPKGSGKSVLLLQAMSWALQREWVVINIPNAHDVVIGHTEYERDAASGLWVQREYTGTLLSRIVAANKPVLSGIRLSKTYNFGRQEFTESTDLARFCEVGSRDTTISHEVYMTLLDELALSGRPPVLFTLDSLNFLMQPSGYHDQDYNVIHSHDLALVKTYLDFLNGTRAFPHGLVLCATSGNGAPRTDAFEYALKGWKLPKYSKLDTRIAASIAGAEVMEVGAMDRAEAQSLLEYCRQSGLLREPQPLDEEKVAQRVAVSSGLPKELVAGCVRIMA